MTSDPQMQNDEALEKEPVIYHDGWRCGCEECVAWRERNEPNFRRRTGVGFAEWLELRDEVKQFLAEECVRDSERKTEREKLYESFVAWHGADKFPIAAKQFTEKLAFNGIQCSHDRRYYLGVGLTQGDTGLRSLGLFAPKPQAQSRVYEIKFFLTRIFK